MDFVKELVRKFNLMYYMKGSFIMIKNRVMEGLLPKIITILENGLMISSMG
jgi:hypothetical protein